MHRQTFYHTQKVVLVELELVPVVMVVLVLVALVQGKLQELVVVVLVDQSLDPKVEVKEVV